jgi:hypothetical protein
MTPRHLKIFANYPNIIDFADAENTKPHLDISLLEGGTEAVEYPLRVAAFTSVHSLSLYFVSFRTCFRHPCIPRPLPSSFRPLFFGPCRSSSFEVTIFGGCAYRDVSWCDASDREIQLAEISRGYTTWGSRVIRGRRGRRQRRRLTYLLRMREMRRWLIG